MLNTKKKNYLPLILSLICCLGLLATFNFANAVEDSHTGHDHEVEATACACDAHAEHTEEAQHDADRDDHAGHIHEEVVDNDEHDHAEHSDYDDHDKADDHADHNHGAVVATGHEGHDHEDGIILDAASEKIIGLQTAIAETGNISTMVQLTGQVQLNQDKLAHIVPLTAGIVRKVNNNIGDQVRKDDILAWIESVELAEAKVRYLDIQAEISCCAINLDRAQLIHDNTLKLIEKLRSKPTLAQLQSLTDIGAGSNSSSLIKAYTQYTVSESVYLREKSLYQQKISSLQEYQTAENDFKVAQAQYLSLLDTIGFQIKQDLLEASGDQHRQEIALKGAERILYVLGQETADIVSLNKLALNPTGAAIETADCPDPDCATCRKQKEQAISSETALENFRLLGWYPLRAAFDSTIIDKHITLGERLSEDTTAFTLADMTKLWIDFDIFAKDLLLVNIGQHCQITLADKSFAGQISFISPILDARTRTATARVIVDNSKHALKPGSFVNGMVYNTSSTDELIIPKAAIQTVEGKPAVFVKEGRGYELRPVTVGKSNRTHIEIHSGIEAGELVVTKGSFELKAKIVTSTLDSHAGHGH